MVDALGSTGAGRRRPGVRWGLFVAGLVVAVVGAGLPAGADTPETGTDPTVVLTVSPDDGLTDGQTVHLVGTGFPATTSGRIRQCAGSVAVPECDTVLGGIFTTDGAGNITQAVMTVQRVITTYTTTYNCGVTTCYLVADGGGKSSRHHISFAGAGTVPGPTTTTGGATTVPPPTTVAPPTTVPPATTVAPPTTVPPDPPPPDEGILCSIVRALGQALPGLLGGLADFLLDLLGCAPLSS